MQVCPRLKHHAVAKGMRSGGTIGGDVYDFIELRGGHLGVVGRALRPGLCG